MTDFTQPSAEQAPFDAHAGEWWDPGGPFCALHAMNPVRLDFLLNEIAARFGCNLRDTLPLSEVRIADVGCGGGLVAEPFARLGGAVTGIDTSQRAIAAARDHAKACGLAIDYRTVSAADLARTGASFDVVTMLEILEHVPDPRALLHDCARLLAPGGIMAVSTINRTIKAWAGAILLAERVLRWAPGGAHEWSKFLTCEELSDRLRETGLMPVRRVGMVFDPWRRAWRLDAKRCDVNYVMIAIKPGDG